MTVILLLLFVLVAGGFLLGYVENLRTEPCCQRRRGCNEPGYVANRQCEHAQALRDAEPWERPALEHAFERVENTPKWALYSFDKALSDYRVVQGGVRQGARNRTAHGEELGQPDD